MTPWRVSGIDVGRLLRGLRRRDLRIEIPVRWSTRGSASSLGPATAGERVLVTPPDLFDAYCVIAQRPASGAVIHVPGQPVVMRLRVVARPTD